MAPLPPMPQGHSISLRPGLNESGASAESGQSVSVYTRTKADRHSLVRVRTDDRERIDASDQKWLFYPNYSNQMYQPKNILKIFFMQPIRNGLRREKAQKLFSKFLDQKSSFLAKTRFFRSKIAIFREKLLFLLSEIFFDSVIFCLI